MRASIRWNRLATWTRALRIMVQAATSLPVFLFALPAGAVGDLVDRRRLSIALQVASAALEMALALSIPMGFTTPG